MQGLAPGNLEQDTSHPVIVPPTSVFAQQTGERPAGSSTQLADEPACTSGVHVELSINENLGQVSMEIRSHRAAAFAERSATCSESMPVRRQLEQEEQERKFSSPDRPAALAGRGESMQGSSQLREAVIGLTERAACLDGLADNEPEVRKVCPLSDPCQCNSMKLQSSLSILF